MAVGQKQSGKLGTIPAAGGQGLFYRCFRACVGTDFSLGEVVRQPRGIIREFLVYFWQSPSVIAVFRLGQESDGKDLRIL